VAVSAKNQWCKLIGRAWSDPSFKSELMQDPVPVMRSYHLEVPDHVRVVEDPKAKIGDWHWEGSGADRTMVVPLPPMPSNWDETVSDSELSTAAAAASGNWTAPGVAAGVAGGNTAHTGWLLPEGTVGTGWTSKGTATGQGKYDSLTWDGAARTAGNSPTRPSPPSVPSVPSVPSASGGDDGGGGDDGSDGSDSSDASDASDACTCSTCL
jgi:hypothetical protein